MKNYGRSLTKCLTLLAFLIISNSVAAQTLGNPPRVRLVESLTLTWDSNVGCSEYIDKDSRAVSFEEISMDDCIVVCENSVVAYSISGGLPNNVDVVWQVNGGTIGGASANNRTIEVEWSGSTTGLITVDIIFPDGDVFTKTQCITIIEAPTAIISLLPLQENEICLNDNVQFLNDSFDNNGSELILFEWVFISPSGQQYFSTEFEPNFTFDESGDWEVSMRATNACGCVSVYDSMGFSVSESESITVDCPTVVCEDDKVVYTANGFEECDRFDWQVLGGTIVDQADNSVTVEWNRPNDTIDGFGIISFDQQNCSGECTGWVVERVPVILTNGDDVIEGPDEICLGEQELYSMPQWPTTRFDWELRNSNGTVVNSSFLLQPDQRNEIVVETNASGQALSPGNYTLEVDYYNTLTECGGTGSKNILITQQTIILPTNDFCVNDEAILDTFGSNTSTNTNWEVYFGNNPAMTYNGYQFSNTFTTAGTYTVVAQTVGQCESEAYQLEIVPLPAAPTANPGIILEGADVTIPESLLICPGVPTNFSYDNQDPNSYLEWDVDANGLDGSIVGSNTGNTVTIIFNELTNPSNTTYQVRVRRILRGEAACESDYYTQTFDPISITNSIVTSAPFLNGQNTFCTSTSAEFNATYSDGEYYTWSVVPDNLGSVVEGQGTQQVTIEWNEIPANYTPGPNDGLRVSVRKCGIDLPAEEYPVTLLDNATLSFVNLPSSICSNENFSLSFTSNLNFDINSLPTIELQIDGQTLTNLPSFNSNTFTFQNIAFEPSNVDYTGTVRILLDDPSGCNDGILDGTINVLASPQVDTVVTSGGLAYCAATWSTTFEAQVQGGVTVTSYQWYNSNGIMTGQTQNTLTVDETDGFGTYWVVVTTSNGCTSRSRIKNIFDNCIVNPACLTPPDVDVVSATWTGCDEITASATYDPSIIDFQWAIYQNDVDILNLPPNANLGSISSNTTINNGFFTANQVGTYNIGYTGSFPNDCANRDTETVTIGYQADLTIEPSCSNQTGYDVTLRNTSPYLLAYTPTSAIYTGRNITTGGATFNIPGNLTEANLSNLSPGEYEFSITIDSPNGPPCTYFEEIDLRLPDANFNIGNTCTENALTLIPSIAERDGYIYEWVFNGTSNLNYTVDIILPQNGQVNVDLIVTDPFGCFDQVRRTIAVNAATFSGIIFGAREYCFNETPQLYYEDGSQFVLDPDFIQWFASGDDVFDANGNLQPLATTTPANPIFEPTESGTYYARAYDGNGCYIEIPAGTVILNDPINISVPDQGQLCKNEDYFLQGTIDASLSDVEYRWLRQVNFNTPVEVQSWSSASPIGININESTSGNYIYYMQVREIGNVDCVSQAGRSLTVVNPPVITIAVDYNCNPNNPYEVELTANGASTLLGQFNWSDGQQGQTITVNRGGAFQVIYYSTYYNCPVVANVEVEKHPEEFIWVFPTGCIEQCEEDVQTEILGPLPNFAQWSWNNNPIGNISGNQSVVDPYDMNLAIYSDSQLNQYLENSGGCHITSGNLEITLNSDLCSIIFTRGSESEGNLKISPNPTKGRTRITYEDLEISNESLRIKIYTLQGVEILHQEVNSQLQGIEFDATHLKTGVYVVRLEGEQMVYLTGQLIKK